MKPCSISWMFGSFVATAAAAMVAACGGGGGSDAAPPVAPPSQTAVGIGSPPPAAGDGAERDADAADEAEVAALFESIDAPARPAEGLTGSDDPQASAPSARHASVGRGRNPGAEPARAVIGWDIFASNLVAATLLPGPQTYVLAITQIAVHDALNAIEPKYRRYAYTGTAPGASVAAAVAAAARDCLARLVPQAAAAIDAEYAAALASVPAGEARNAGVAAGQAAAAAILGLRSADDLDAALTKPYTPRPPAPGVYQLTPPLNFVIAAGWRDLRPFALASAGRFRSPAPYPVHSAKYTRDYREVMRLGAADGTARDAQQSQTARFWYDAATKEWHLAARKGLADVAADEWRAARTLAVLAVAMADTVIASFDTKFEVDFWRPITAIRAGDDDGNPATAGDARWEPLCVTPPFPEHNSTHAAIAAAAAVALGREVGDRHTHTVDSPTLPGVSRTYRSYSAAAVEEGVSRIYCGIHFRHAMNAGLTQGARVADFVDRTLLLRLD